MTNTPSRPKCKGLAGRLFGHQLEPRYSRHIIQPLNIELSGPMATIETLKLITDRANIDKSVYHGDVCARCGLIILEKTVTIITD